MNRLRDRIPPKSGVLLIGINPGIRSAAIGHHFAGHSNRFWKLLFESGLVAEPIRAEDDRRLPEWGFGITNVVPRMTPGIDGLSHSYTRPASVMRAVRRWRPGVWGEPATLYRGCSLPSGMSVDLDFNPSCSKGRAWSCCRTRAAATRTTRR
jgi:TDG/mug DNA glycosylase family protein